MANEGVQENLGEAVAAIDEIFLLVHGRIRMLLQVIEPYQKNFDGEINHVSEDTQIHR